MPDTRFTLIGKACVWIVRAKDSELRRLLALGGWKGTSLAKLGKNLKRKKKRKGRFRKGSPEAKRYMAKIRRMR